MTLEELYARIGGDYDAALAYLRSERLIARLVQKFLDDRSLPRFFEAQAAGDAWAAFEAVHEAKGVCSNLYFTRLTALASAATEALRPSDGSAGTTDSAELASIVRELRKAYDATTSEIAAFAATL